MKIGILTYHRSVNDGAVVQAYCLQRLLAAQFPEATVEFVDYRSLTLELLEYRRMFTRRPPFLRMHHIRRLWELRAFVRRHFPCSASRCTTDDLEEARRFINRQDYDVLVVGSDTVWEVRESGNGPPAPNIYFLSGVRADRKIAFAVSADPVEPVQDFLAAANRGPRLAQAVEAFDQVYVRDEATRALFAETGVRSGHLQYLPDPAVLGDFSPLVDVPRDLKRPGEALAGVAVASHGLRRAATRMLRARGYEVVNLLGPSVEGQRTPPKRYALKQRLGTYALLDFMVTDRFHGSIFTLLLSGSPVLFIENGGKWPLPNSKGRDLFTRLGLAEMVWRYEGGAVPAPLVDRYADRWEELAVDVDEAFSALKEAAWPKLRAIRQAVRGAAPAAKDVPGLSS